MSEFAFDREKMELPVTRDEIWNLFLSQTAVNLEIVHIVVKLAEITKSDQLSDEISSLFDKIVTLIDERDALIKTGSAVRNEG